MLIQLLVIFAAARAAVSQTAAPAQVLAGSVQDPAKASISGATVTLKRIGSADRQSTTADATGAFRFDGIVAGNYEIQVQHHGFKPFTSRVKIGQTAPPLIRIVLSLADVRQEITVRDEASHVNTNAPDNLDTITLSRQALDDLPIFDQDYVGAMSRFLDAGAVGTNGITLIVDGVEATRVGVSASAIQEVKINQNPYSAEYSRPGRGRIEIFTKPGSQEYHGTFNFLFRDYRLNARDPFALSRPVEQRRIFEGSLTGPVGKSKRTSFVVSGNREEEDLQSVVFAIGPSGPIRENVPSPQRNTEFSGSVTRQMSEDQLISLRGVYTDRTIHNQGVGGFTLPEAGANFEDREDLLIFNHRGLVTPKVMNLFRIMFGRQHTPTASAESGPKIVVLDAFTGGGAQADRLQTENHINLNEILSWSSNKHVIKTGINIPDISRRGLDDDTNFAGTYSFSTVQDYLNHRPFSFVRQQGEGHVVFLEKVIGGFVQDEYRFHPNLSISAGLRYDWQNYFHDNNNFAPRLSLAYAPGNSRTTVIRTGAGLFYDRTGPGPIFDLLRYDGLRLRRYLVTGPELSYPFNPAGINAEPTSVVRLDPTVKIPYMLQYGAGIERQLQKSTTVTINYLGLRGINQFRSRDVNAPPPPFYMARPNLAFSGIRQIESSADLRSHSLEVAVRGNITRFFSGMVQYTLARAYNNTGGNSTGGTRTSGINTFPANNYDLSGEWARADFDQRHRFNLLGTITPGRYFKLGVGLFLNSGLPYTMTTGRDDNHDGLATDRPPGVARNTLQGPGFAELDMRWSRDFFFVKAKKDKGPAATIGMDAFNLLNRVNYAGFSGNLSSPFFGRAVAAQPPRRLQLSVRFKF